MARFKQQINIFHTLIILTVLFICAQLSFALITLQMNGLLSAVTDVVASKMLFSKVIFFPLLQLLAAQTVIYIFYIYFLWYTTISLQETFKLQLKNTQLICILLWFNSVVNILFLNMYYVPHSLFTSVLQHEILNDALTNIQIKNIALITSGITLLTLLIGILNTSINFYKKRNFLRKIIFSSIIIIITCITYKANIFGPHKNITTANKTKPNLIILSFDALRPDFLSYFNKARPETPNFDNFLKSAVIFKDAYTPIARTSPSWVGILTAKYPLHNGIRENNMPDNLASLDETLAKQLDKAGYETIYATDDKGFNMIDKSFGFDHIVSPNGSIADLITSALNDLPLSNLIVTTPIGKILFPYSYANHASAYTYDPENFLTKLNTALQARENKPLFLAVHFDLSAWPFYWFNDKLAYNANEATAYANSVRGNDIALEKFLALLKNNNLLDHTIVVLISDHGITLALHNDRVIAKEYYQGNKLNMKVLRAKYSNAENNLVKLENIRGHGKNLNLQIDKNTLAISASKDFGVDTSYGYGGDLLSLKQNHPVLAFKAYGMRLTPHTVNGPSMLLDITPTLLDMLDLPALMKADGISLKPYLSDPKLAINNDREIYLESCFGRGEIEHTNINTAEVIQKNISSYQIDLDTGYYHLNADYYLSHLVNRRQRAILQGNWLLVYYPASERMAIVRTTSGPQFRNLVMPPYFVLVNLKTHQWTTEANNLLAKQSPMASLKNKLNLFYGSEMAVYR